MLPAQLLTRAILTNVRLVLQSQSYRQPSWSRRPFSVTQPTQATESLDEFRQAFQKTSIFQKLAGHQDALIALEQFAKVLQNAGIDLTAGKPPSTMKMLKLAANSEFRVGINRVTEEMKKAGVDFQSPEVMNELMSLKKPGGPLS